MSSTPDHPGDAHAPPATPPPRRHDFCTLHPGTPANELHLVSVDGQPADVASPADQSAARAVLSAWLAAGRPFVVRRPCTLLDPPRVCLALCAPRDAAPRRVAVDVPAAAVARRSPPPDLRSTLPAAPPHWHAPLQRLADAFDALGLHARVFGSLAWQALTGLAYLHPQSDVDLLADVPAAAWRAALADNGQPSATLAPLLASLDAAPFRCDVELRSPAGGAVALAELRQRSTHLLLRDDAGPRLVLRGDLRRLAP